MKFTKHNNNTHMSECGQYYITKQNGGGWVASRNGKEQHASTLKNAILMCKRHAEGDKLSFQ